MNFVLFLFTSLFATTIPVQGALVIGEIVDSHRWKLQDIKNVIWHVGYTPVSDPWKISP